ncbi:MAG: hypothetical protein KAH32_04325 [Chlamydiia bacterium]|nr:hypothetical protein [Chlamydiia bacterium]
MPVPISTIPNVSYGFSQRLDATHYLIGTESKGVYQVAVDANGMVKTAVPVLLSTIPDTSYGFAQQIDATHYLIGTKDNGIYQVTANLNGNGLVNSAVQSAPSVTTGIPSDLQDGFSQQIDPTHYLIGTHRNGVYEVIVDSNGMIQSSHHVFMSGTVSIPNVGSG